MAAEIVRQPRERVGDARIRDHRAAFSALRRSACRRGVCISSLTKSSPVCGHQRVRRTVGDQAALAHHRDAVGEQQRLHHVVGDHHRGEAERVVQARGSPGKGRRG